MYRIINLGSDQIGITESVNYIKVGKYGTYVPTEHDEAEGVAIDGTPYSLIGHDPLPGAEETVAISKFDGAHLIAEQEEVIDDILVALSVVGEDGE